MKQDIEDEFRFNKTVKTQEDVDYVHGRIETRTSHVIDDFIPIQNPEKKEQVKPLIKIEKATKY